ncbi:MAG: hypothetical protein OEV86_14515 [Candidatus Krumholzibacteria bacterium]|nr:hypothetical protein [Candidatus Krumholzibacteria bacterium]
MRNHTIFLAAALILAGCSDDPADVPEPAPVTDTHVIRDVDYVKDRYFYVDDPVFFYGAMDTGFEVWRRVTPQDLILDPTIMRFPGWAVPDSVGDGQSIVDAVDVIKAGSRQFAGLVQEFMRLEQGVDFTLVLDASTPTIVGIELTDPLPAAAQRTLALRYTNINGAAVGGSYASFGVIDPANGQPLVPGSAADTLMLEMIKAPDPRPTGPFASVWRLAVRNVYDLGFTDIQAGEFKVVIEDVLTIRTKPDRPDGSAVPYLRIFGLDVTDTAGTGGPDGKIDLTRGLVDLQRGLLILPDVRGFAPSAQSVDAWTNGAFAFTGLYQAQFETAERIYDDYLNATDENDVHQYVIKASITHPAAP